MTIFYHSFQMSLKDSLLKNILTLDLQSFYLYGKHGCMSSIHSIWVWECSFFFFLNIIWVCVNCLLVSRFCILSEHEDYVMGEFDPLAIKLRPSDNNV